MIQIFRLVTEKFAKGGEIAKSEIIALGKNIMGTIDIEMKITGMRKPQEFSVYPITKDDSGKIITIQSDTRIGKIDLDTGRGVMSQSHSNGAYFVHFQMDNLTPFTVSESDLEKIKARIFATAGDNVGTSGVVTDNSGASRVLAKGGDVENGDIYYQADYYDKRGGHGSLHGYSANFNAEYKKAMELYSAEKKSGELGKSTGYIGVNGTGNEFAIIYLDKDYLDNMEKHDFSEKSYYDTWMEVAKKVLETGKPQKGKWRGQEKFAKGGELGIDVLDELDLSESQMELLKKAKPMIIKALLKSKEGALDIVELAKNENEDEEYYVSVRESKKYSDYKFLFVSVAYKIQSKNPPMFHLDTNGRWVEGSHFQLYIPKDQIDTLISSIEGLTSFANGGGVGEEYSVWELPVNSNPIKKYTGTKIGATRYANQWKKKKLLGEIPNDGRGLQTWGANVTEDEVLKYNKGSHYSATSQEYAKGGDTGLSKDDEIYNISNKQKAEMLVWLDEWRENESQNPDASIYGDFAKAFMVTDDFAGKFIAFVWAKSRGYSTFAKGGGVGVGEDWFWNHAYRHYMRDASLEQRKKVREQFIKEDLELDGESPKHAYIVVSVVKPSELKYFKKIGNNAIEYANGGGIGTKDSDGFEVVEVYNGYNIYDKGSNAKYRFYARDKEIEPPYTEGSVIANGASIDMVKQDLKGKPKSKSTFANMLKTHATSRNNVYGKGGAK
jgi:hypothetical protein